ncbi:hypothetical protein [Legionella jordanis]|uniref:Uncharacterized protein n=1 Tax=Legionella jordanis TaxID=456 RepID=A0A0W0VFJ2_9GAMM|nr:hypothetical protein [Legionella jordanis]KTD18910.1 hypothetical protein Ljor_0133 [Legionella jordanis]RMX05525.1 hypothetical protein EAW55_02415 [Legionella jordanis]RMX19210.1 hypothetical protein EAS68_07180 [Legionella jordanis]VEH13010.1 Uncharacterised protein [Legionella jordanis]HAT8714053.1 hypothetical protein [Legionella jordanis]
MKLYRTLSEAVGAIRRKPKEVIAIISFNGQAYFVFRSNPSPEVATIIQAQMKILIANELLGITRADYGNDSKEQLYEFMLQAKIPELFPESRHAEENLILGFSGILEQFKTEFPEQKIRKIDIFLSHSPCSEQGVKRCSGSLYLNDFFLPSGCDQKLIAFFKKGNYVDLDRSLFLENSNVQVRYHRQFDSAVENHVENFIIQAEPELKDVFDHHWKNASPTLKC